MRKIEEAEELKLNNKKIKIQTRKTIKKLVPKNPIQKKPSKPNEKVNTKPTKQNTNSKKIEKQNSKPTNNKPAKGKTGVPPPPHHHLLPPHHLQYQKLFRNLQQMQIQSPLSQKLIENKN